MVAMSVEAEPTIRAAYLFPDREQIRVVYVDPIAPPGVGDATIRPFFFAPDSAGGIDYPSAIVLIRPEEKDVLQPPVEWGDWSLAELLWEAR